MSVHVVMTKTDGTKEEMICRGWIEAAAYLETHRGMYTEISAQQVSADEIKQGRGGNG